MNKLIIAGILIFIAISLIGIGIFLVLRKDSKIGNGGDGGDGTKGKNQLGKILTALIHIIKYRNCSNMSLELKKKIRLDLNT